jgi:molecular chaperone GrpE
MSPRKSKTKLLEEKISELETSLEKEKMTSEKYLNQLKYTKADLENLQKRIQRNINDSLERASAQYVLQLLPILDELDLAISLSKNSTSNILEGVEMIRGKMWKFLEAKGLSLIEAIGHPFDPNYHEAVLEVETKDVEDGHVAEEFRKGYFFKGKVLRATMVKVAKNTSSDKDQEDVENE